MVQTRMTTEEFKRLTQAQTRERSDAAPPKRRKKATEPNRAEIFRPITEPVLVTVPLPPPLNHYYRTVMIA